MKRLMKVTIPFVIASMVLSGCSKNKDIEEQEVEITPVEVQDIEFSSIKKEMVYVGEVEPNQTVTVTSKLSGRVENVNYDVGDYVNAGDTLFILDKKDIQDQIKQLEAQLLTTNASVKSAQTGLSQAESGGQIASSRLTLETAVENAKIALDDSVIALENARETLTDTEKKYNDTKLLYDAGVATKSDFDTVDLAYTKAKNGVESAVNANTKAQTAYNQAVESLNIFDSKTTSDSVEVAENSYNTALAGREAVLTQLQIARETLTDTVITAPISGVISKRNIDKTNMVSAAAAPFVIVDMSSVTVNVNVSEKIINSINVGQKIDVEIPTLNNGMIEGTIKSIVPSTDASKTYPVTINIDNSDGRIKPGMFAEIHIIESESDNTVVLPRNTVFTSESGHYLFVVEDDTVIRKDVELGIDNGEYVEVKSGIEIHEMVIVEGHNYVEDNQKVRIVNSELSEEAAQNETEN